MSTASPHPSHAAPRRRARRVRQAVALVAGLLVVLGGAVLGVVAILGGLDARGPIIQRCDARLTDSVEASLAPDQAGNAALLTAVALRRELPARAATIAIATGVQESKLRNIDYGDRDSLGLFQQRPSQGWGTAEQLMDPVYATNAFYDVLVTIEGYEDLQVTDAAQRVQRSAFPDAYADHEQMARAFASALTGYAPAGLTCLLDPTTDEERIATPQLVTERLNRDFAVLTAAADADGTLLIDASALAPEAGEDERIRLGWAVAQWAVATAHETGVSTVTTDGTTWERADGVRAGWVPASPDEPVLAAGTVLVR